MYHLSISAELGTFKICVVVSRLTVDTGKVMRSNQLTEVARISSHMQAFFHPTRYGLSRTPGVSLRKASQTRPIALRSAIQGSREWEGLLGGLAVRVFGKQWEEISPSLMRAARLGRMYPDTMMGPEVP